MTLPNSIAFVQYIICGSHRPDLVEFSRPSKTCQMTSLDTLVRCSWSHSAIESLQRQTPQRIIVHEVFIISYFRAPPASPAGKRVVRPSNVQFPQKPRV